MNSQKILTKSHQLYIKCKFTETSREYVYSYMAKNITVIKFVKLGGKSCITKVFDKLLNEHMLETNQFSI